MSALRLRRVEVLAHARAQALQRWRRAGHGAGLGRPEQSSGYLRFAARGGEGEWRGLTGAQDWLSHALPGLRALLTDACPATRIVRLFQAVAQPLVLPVDELRYSELIDIELITAAPQPVHDWPWLDTPRGRVWVTQLPAPRSLSRPLTAPLWLRGLPLPLELLLGVSHLCQDSRARLGVGDVLRITHRTDQCLLAGQCIGHFTFTPEGIHMQSTLAEPLQQHTEETPAQADLATLPLRLEFLLARQDTDLGTLAQMIEGQLIALASDAAQHIEVRANGKPVARGELVQLEQGLGVEVLEVYRSEQPL